jgi:hypothetical protein
MELSLFQHQAFSGSNQIRLLTILPGEKNAAVKLELEHTDIESDVKYECLSYAWGADNCDQLITLNNCLFRISATLHIALKHLRYASKKRKIWIDAISINQADIAERNHQVAMMRKVYENAMRVIVWLGPATESSEQAMAFLKMMGTTRKNRNPSFDMEDPTIASDANSELGPGEEENYSSNPQGYPHTFKDYELGLRNEDTILDSSHGSIAQDQNSVSVDVTSSNSDKRERLRRLISNKALNDRSIRSRLKNLSTRSYASVLRLYHRIKTLLAYLCFWRGFSYVRAIQRATKNDFAVTGFPILWFGRGQEKYFTNEWESHWQALDALLARPWWERTCIVQEVWSTSDAVLQCGATTIKWKTFQEAMDYSEAWDDMWDNVKGTKREAQWDTLRRRYTLAIHLAKARVNGRTLASLLVNTWDRACTDPRDKVFAMLALVGATEDVSMTPDYGKSMQQVYREVARDIISKEGQMDILLAASGVNGNNGLPSWVPDWRYEANAKKPTLLVNRHLMMKLYTSGSMDAVVLEGHGYRAAGNSEAVAFFSDDLNVLTVLAKKCDKLAEVCEADITELQDTEFTDQAFDFVLRSKFVSTNTRWRESGEQQRSTDSSDTSILLTTLTGGGNIRNDRRAPTMRNIMRRRRLFVTQGGHLGIGPVDAQPNDEIFIISGCNFPIVLRPRDNKFAVVGETYSECSIWKRNLCDPANVA